MSHQVILPPLADPATEFVVEQLYVDVDASIVAGQAVALVRSNRFAWDIPATTSGIVSRLAAEEGDTVVLGAPLIEMREQAPTGYPENKEQGSKKQEQALETAAQSRVRATPVARRVAASHDIDLATLSGTGRGKSITRADVLAAIRKQQSAVSNQQLAVSSQRTQTKGSEVQTPAVEPSAFSLPYALTAIEVDASAARAFMAKHERRARRGVTISITACVAAAVVVALGEHRMFNSAWSDDGIILRRGMHLLIEQPHPEDTQSGMQAVLVPAAADLNPLGIGRRLARSNNEQQGDHGQATFTISQRREPWWGHAQPNGTHTASLTFGDVTQQPRVEETANGDTIAIRPVVLLVLAYDARVGDQHQADAFLRTVQQRLEHFDRL